MSPRNSTDHVTIDRKHFDGRLTDYRVLAETTPATSGPTRWPVYAAAVGSSLAFAATAGADTIHYSGLQNITVHANTCNPLTANGSCNNVDELGIDMDGDGYAYDVYINASFRRFFYGGVRAF